MESVDETVTSQGATSHKVNGKIKEVITIFVPSEYVGRDQLNPPNPYQFTLANELRSTYFNTGKQTGVQFARWSNEYSVCDKKKPLVKIVANGNAVIAVYGHDDEWCLKWDVETDGWEHGVETPEEPAAVVWSTNPKEQTTARA